MAKHRLNCNHCGKFVWKYSSMINNRNYCNPTCSARDRAKENTKQRIEVTCASPKCDNKILVLESIFNHVNDKCCNRKCASELSRYQQLLYPKTYKLRNKIVHKNARKNISDFYVRKLESAKTDINYDDVPQHLIDISRKHLKLKRLIS